MTYEETINPSAIKTVSDISEIALPDTFRCPICGEGIHVEEVADFEEEDGALKAMAVKIDCNAVPDLDDVEALDEYISEHYAMPYVDWLPLERQVTEWVNKRYSWEMR